ncbi:DNA recombination protein RmuC [Candidatus Peregrinibacteria bacterium CG11_big_fil_rev_8_21_14_0_20_41_10]|nr:MAG: DNA recombination protein RmuC [Candidatus Peregrinibacteria bacterium CG11_big_fil_rev_8_21_14_0_20_41_10]PIZ76340.1 MAG: DNA recombination protein RmuC [Candidatus Peregrinibacteria bacterium CG_4_10_14_0_2_um_filter_41_8]PJC37619.1 MAG: DNA recombination protein RmuC [Candidatus Peregrinibacteria bacterium CG_4_9_14_0_2_um_filter_41_14]
MQTLLVFFGLLILAGLGYLIYLLLQQISDLRRDVNESGGKSREEMQSRLDNISLQINKHQGLANDTIKEITERLTMLNETNKQVVGFAEQMKSLENILKNPKQRGILGEYMLETLLQNVLPPQHFEMQHKFKNGLIVDAAVFFKEMVIPIDAKFSLEKYNLMMTETDKDKRELIERDFKSDVKKRIDETSKYVQPENGTTDFAFMFIPAEGIYYNLLIYDVGSLKVNTHDLIEYAFSKRVVIVSPTSFFAYLKTVLQGLKALTIEKNALEIKKYVGDLSKHLNAYGAYMDKVGTHLGTTVSMYNQASREFKKLDKDIYKVTDGTEGGNMETLMLEKPVETFEE